MARPVKIHYKRITLSLPEAVVKKLRRSVGQNKMSSYVAEVVEKDLDRKLADEASDFVEDLKKFALTNPLRTNKDSLTLLREIRYGA
ncbi:MAG: hypothetical protein PHP74_04900 [Candidatus Gracilibacteria bacterium]|nr:hypothetical protein [Candidatus Gracilibacteria bacterium]